MPRLLFSVILGLTLIANIFSPSISKHTDNPVITEILAETQQLRWVRWIADLSGENPVRTKDGEGKILTRSSFVMFEPGQIPSAFTYLLETLQGMGFQAGQDFEVHTLDFPYAERHAERNWKNVILTFPGTDPALKEELVLMVAHLDSTSDQERTLAPGADDNASGAAGLLEAAAVLRHYRFDRTIHLIWFSGEEQSRRGSEYFVEDYADWLPNIIGVVNLDMFAFDWDNDRCFEIHAGTLPGSNAIGQIFQSVISSYELDLTFDLIDDDTAYTFSDHHAFWEQDIPAVMVFENGFYQEGKTCGNADRNYSYHTTADTLSYINQDSGFSILQASLAVITHMAGPSGRCFAEPPVIHKYLHRERVYLEWNHLPQAEHYQVWLAEDDGWVLTGQTKNTHWVMPIHQQEGMELYQIIAVTRSGCQSAPGTYPDQ